MSIKISLETPTVRTALYAIPAPRPSDTVGGALRCAFAPPRDESVFSVLLARIDQIDRCRGNA